MTQPATSAPGYQRFQPKDSRVAVQFGVEALEQMLADVMTGFGAIPRRGAEVGGILLGRFGPGTVWVDDVLVTPCEHRRGPSFLLSEADTAKFDQAFKDARSAAETQARPVGLFRSNTRDAEGVGDEDRALFSKYFPTEGGLFLIIRPFATKPPTGSFLFGRDGTLATTATEVFEFTRGGDHATTGARRRIAAALDRPPKVAKDSTPDPISAAAPVEPPPSLRAERVDEISMDESEPDSDSYSYPAQAQSRQMRRGWLWIPLSFIFLVLGVLLGFQSALTFYPKPSKVDAAALSLGLNVLRRGDNLHIRWNREAPSIRNAQRGKLLIEDGDYRKTVDLDPSALQNGSVIYPPASVNVSLRFEVVLPAGTQISEGLGWSKKQE